MKKQHCWVVLLGILCGMNFRSASVSAGTVTESGSDAFYFSGWDFTPTPDLIFASATFDTTYLYLSVRITPGFPTIDPVTLKGNTFIGFYLDIDQNPATGYSGYCSGSCDVGILGWERRVGFATGSPTSAFLSTDTFSSLGTFPATRQPDGFDTRIPLASLGDDGLLNFKVLEDVQLSPSSTTTIMDVLPNQGLAAGTSTFVPEPASLSCAAFVAMSSIFMRRKRGPRSAGQFKQS